MIRETARLKNFLMALLIGSVLLAGTMSAFAETGTDFAGAVLSVDAAAGKLAVKKEPGGTRFTFVVNDKTQFSGAGVKSLADIKKGDNVTVKYVVSGSQYVAQTITVKGK
jgi:Cu/Ag efflux protein CusF